MLIPRPKTTGPAARHIHSRDYGVLAANKANEIDGAVDQHPPEVRVLALTKNSTPGAMLTSVPPLIKSAS